MGSHRRKIHNIKGKWKGIRKAESYSYSKVQLERANKVEEFQNTYASKVYAFEAPMTAKWKGEMPKSFDPKTHTVNAAGYRVDLMDWVKFMGIFLAEGCCRGTLAGLDLSPNSEHPHYVQALNAAASTTTEAAYKRYTDNPGLFPHAVRISQTSASKHNCEVREEIGTLLNKLPWQFKADFNEFTIIDERLHKYLFRFGNSYTKYVPKWLKNLPPEYLSEFIKWAVMGDGHLHENGCRGYWTVSKQLADDMQEIYQRSGTWAQLTVDYENGIYGFGKSGRQAPLFSISEHGSEWGSYPKPERVNYQGYVYCAALKNKTVYVRRNGKPVWSGRSETPIPRRAINLVRDGALSLEWKVEPTKEALQKTGGKITPELQEKIDIATRCLDSPNNTDSWNTFSSAVLEDIIVGGYGTIEPRLTPNYLRPFKLWAVDGSTVRIYADWSESTEEKPHWAQLTGLKGERGIISFRDDELIYLRTNVRSSTPFGLGSLEIAFNSTNAFLGAQDMSARSASDQVHKTWMWWEQTQAVDFLQTVRRHIQNEIEGQGKTSLIAGFKKPEILDVKAVTPEDLLLEWQEFLIRIIGTAFNLSPQNFGLERDVNRNTSETMSETDFKSAVVPIAVLYREHINRNVLWRMLDWKGIQFTWIGLEDPDAETQSKIWQTYWACYAITPDDIRSKLGMDPMIGGWGKLNLGQYTILQMAARAQGQQNKQGAQQPGGQQPGQQQQQMSPQDIQQLQQEYSPEEIKEMQQQGLLPNFTPPAEEPGGPQQEPATGVLEQYADQITQFLEEYQDKEKKKHTGGKKVNVGALKKEQEQRFKKSEHEATKEEKQSRNIEKRRQYALTNRPKNNKSGNQFTDRFR
jgi:hypothetical protein